MIIVIHITIALLSIVSSVLLFFKQTKFNFALTYSLVAATLASGTYLVVQSHSSLAHACITGLVYLAVVLFGLIPAHYKYAARTKSTI